MDTMPAPPSRRASIVASLVFLLAGCTEGAEHAQRTVDVTPAELIWQVGTVSGEEWETFGSLTAVAMDPLGRVFAADAQGSVIRAYDARGEYLGIIGREGEGPGKFLYPTAITPAPDGSLWIRDDRGVTRVTILEGE